MLNQVVRWLRAEARKGHAPRRCARWIGRNWARVSYGRGVEPTWLELTRHEVPVAGLPPAFAGYRGTPLGGFEVAVLVRALVLVACLAVWVLQREPVLRAALPARLKAPDTASRPPR